MSGHSQHACDDQLWGACVAAAALARRLAKTLGVPESQVLDDMANVLASLADDARVEIVEGKAA